MDVVYGEGTTSATEFEKFVKQDDYTRAMCRISLEAVRTKADILQLRDKTEAILNSMDGWWACDAAQNIKIAQLQAANESFKKKLLTTQVVLAIVALSAAVAAFI